MTHWTRKTGPQLSRRKQKGPTTRKNDNGDHKIALNSAETTNDDQWLGLLYKKRGSKKVKGYGKELPSTPLYEELFESVATSRAVGCSEPGP